MNKKYIISASVVLLALVLAVYFLNATPVASPESEIQDSTEAIQNNEAETVVAPEVIKKEEPKAAVIPVKVPVAEEVPVQIFEPVKKNYTANWSGKFIANSQCGTFSGDWTLKTIDTDGILTGHWNSTDGTSGDIKGTAKDDHLEFNGVYGDYVLLVVSFDVAGNDVVNGVFSRTLECSSGSGPVPGTITGSRK